MRRAPRVFPLWEVGVRGLARYSVAENHHDDLPTIEAVKGVKLYVSSAKVVSSAAKGGSLVQAIVLAVKEAPPHHLGPSDTVRIIVGFRPIFVCKYSRQTLLPSDVK